MRLKRATSLKKYRRRRRRRFGDDLDDDFGARRRRRRRKKRRRPHKGGRRRHAQPRKRRWSEAVPLGENIRIQAKDGYRGAYMELRPGLYVVAELRTEGLEGEFGRKVRPQDVASEIFRVSSQAMNAFMPRQQAQPQQQAAPQPTTTQSLPPQQTQRALPAPQQQYAQPQQPYAQPQQQYAQPQQQYVQPQQQYATAAPPQQAPAPAPQAQPARTGPASFLPPAAARWMSMLGDEER